MVTTIECPCAKCDLRKWYARKFDMHIYGEDCFFECEEYDEYKRLKNECDKQEEEYEKE